MLSVESWAGPRVAEGILGCPFCNARYPIHEGTVHFSSAGPVRRGQTVEDVDVMRLAAQLGLTDSGGMILLTGRYAAIHGSLTDLADVTWILLGVQQSASAGAVNFELENRLPLLDGALRGAAIDPEWATLLPEAARSTRPGGRIVAPGGSPIPPGVRLIARDEREWVGEVENVSTVQLRRSERSSTL